MIIEKLDKWARGQFLQAARAFPIFSPLLSELESRRGQGRNDYPVSSMWELIELMIAVKSPSIRSLRNAVKGDLPSPFSFSRFLASLEPLFGQINSLLIDLADPGEIGAVGSIVRQKKRHTFLWDAETGLPFIWESGPKKDLPSNALVRLLAKIPPRKMRFLICSPEYEELSCEIWKKWRIRPIIPLSKQSGEKKSFGPALYNENGELFCPSASMVFGGFEEKREALKFLCPAKHYGYACKDLGSCPLERNIRVPLKADPRIFGPLPRSSYRWQNLWSLYEKRARVEEILTSRIPRMGESEAFLRITSLLFAAAYRTKKLSKRA